MKSKIVHPDRESNYVTGAYSDAVIANGIVYVSGQASVDFKNSTFVLGTIEEETIRTLENIKSILTAAGSSMNDVVKCTVHLADITEFDRYNKIYLEWCIATRQRRWREYLDQGLRSWAPRLAHVARSRSPAPARDLHDGRARGHRCIRRRPRKT